MSTKHTHCYSNYVNHILNNSSTKTTYTFPKGQRFEPSVLQPKAPIDQILQKAFPSPSKKTHEPLKQFATSNKKLVNNFLEKDTQPLRYPATAGHANRKDQINRSRQIGQNKQIYPFQKYLNNEIIRNPDNGKNFERSKSSKAVKFAEKDVKAPSPFNPTKRADKKKKVWGKNETPQKSQKKKKYNLRVQTSQNIRKDVVASSEFPENNGMISSSKYLKYSPYYRQFMRENDQENSLSREKKAKWKGELSRQRSNKRHSRIKTSTIVLEQMDHPSKHITVQGYYPLGTQLNPNGKYVPSTYKNVPVHSFGKSPSKNQKSSKKMSITPDKSKNLLPTEKYPESSFYYKNLSDKKSGKEIKSLEERYVPFSEFGNPSPYRY